MTRVTTVTVPKPAWKFRLFLSTIFLLTAFAGAEIYKFDQGPREGALAVQQLENDDTAYAKSRWVAAHDIPGLIWTAGWVLVGLTWLTGTPGLVRYLNASQVRDEAESDVPTQGATSHNASSGATDEVRPEGDKS